MCGVVGALVFDGGGFEVTEPYLVRMRDAMEHRGPDGAGVWISKDRRVGLGHRRLAIIDLSDAAAQPMSNEDGSIWVSFNGEIYNHADIRRELTELGGHVWRTDHSDTEVILHAFEQWGIDCLNRFRGMFAIALWDARKQELWLVRDRIGVKPLYYSVHHGRITFASEIKALLRDADLRPAINEEALYHYLSFLTSPPPQTLFAGIAKLEGGTWAKVTPDGRVHVQRYWDVWDHTVPLQSASEVELAERVISELRTSVRLRKVSDVPVGVFLSGGLDSSTNAVLFSEGERETVRTFSIGYDLEHSGYQSELGYARRVAEQVGAEHRERVLTLRDVMDVLPRLAYMQDEPIADPVCVPVYYLSNLAREHGVTVCQVGEGADELFWGYPAWGRDLRVQRAADLPVPGPAKGLGLAGLRLLGREDRRYYEWLRRDAAGQPVFWSGVDAFTRSEKARLLSPRLRRAFAGADSWDVLQPIRQQFLERAWDTSALNWMTYSDLRLRLPELLLMRVDKMAMPSAIEGRVPFLDHKFVELAMSIPAAMKTRSGVTKQILKSAVRGLVPDEIIDRKKQGFSLPVESWLGRNASGANELQEATRAHLERLCDEVDLLDRSAVRRQLEYGSGPQAWCLLNLALWWQAFLR